MLKMLMRDYLLFAVKKIQMFLPKFMLEAFHTTRPRRIYVVSLKVVAPLLKLIV